MTDAKDVDDRTVYVVSSRSTTVGGTCSSFEILPRVKLMA